MGIDPAYLRDAVRELLNDPKIVRVDCEPGGERGLLVAYRSDGRHRQIAEGLWSQIFEQAQRRQRHEGR